MSGYVSIEENVKGNPINLMTDVEGTTTSAIIDARGKNAILIAIGISVAAQNWTIKLQGCLTKTGTYIDIYELANTGSMAQMSYQTDASKMILFKGIPDYIKVVATEDVTGAKCSVDVQLLNI